MRGGQVFDRRWLAPETRDITTLTMRCPGFRYSGCLMKRKWTVALSPVLRLSCDILTMEAVWRTLPTCTAKKTDTERDQ